MSIFSKQQLEELPICGYSCRETSLVKIQVSIAPNTNWLIIGWAEKDELFFGYTCINGAKQSAEMGSISLEQLEDLANEFTITVSEPNITLEEARDAL